MRVEHRVMESAARRWLQVLAALPEPKLRVSWLAAELEPRPLDEAATILDALLAPAEATPHEAAVGAFCAVQLLIAPDQQTRTRALRWLAAGRPALGALHRVLGMPAVVSSGADTEAMPTSGRPLLQRGRPLTLGERKWLARRPDRQVIDKLLAEAHPDVIKELLGNPHLGELDVVRMAARRPAVAQVLSCIASSRWLLQPAVRRALVYNPYTPRDISLPILALLSRGELRALAAAPDVPALLRQSAAQHLAERPGAPGRIDPD